MNYESPFAEENGVPESTPQDPLITQFGMRWEVRPMPAASRVSRDIIDRELPIFRGAEPYKELGAVGITNALPKFYFEDWE
jgi:hypothetical protein